MIPARYEPYLFSLLLSGMMSFTVRRIVGKLVVRGDME